MGFVGNDPEAVGEQGLRFSLATRRRGYKKENGEEVSDTTDWHNIVVFRDRECKFIREYVKKGHLITIEGEIRYSTYVDKEGISRKSTDIFVTSVSFPNIGSKKDKESEAYDGENKTQQSNLDGTSSDLPF